MIRYEAQEFPKTLTVYRILEHRPIWVFEMGARNVV